MKGSITGSTFYIGLMSGTSADAIDAVLVDFADTKPRLITSHSTPIPNQLRQQIHQLATPSNNEIDQLGQLDRQLGLVFAEAINQLILNAGIDKNHIAAIGSHGQTIRHRPPLSIEHPFTLQIGDPNIIAQYTGITTVADFRRRDMAAGGQGAPLVPAFHKAIFQSEIRDRAIINIGGMANITWLPASGSATGFDTGPGNVLMDAWIYKHQGKPYDANGDWAAAGTADSGLLAQLLEHPFFRLPAPKSTGREAFNLDWLSAELTHYPHQIKPEDVQSTLVNLTATSIANELQTLTTTECDLFVCGGGAYNQHLMSKLQALLPGVIVYSTKELGVAPEWVEAMAFAWLAKQTMHRQSGNLRAVTGANEEVILGGVYFA